MEATESEGMDSESAIVHYIAKSDGSIACLPFNIFAHWWPLEYSASGGNGRESIRRSFFIMHNGFDGTHCRRYIRRAPRIPSDNRAARAALHDVSQHFEGVFQCFGLRTARRYDGKRTIFHDLPVGFDLVAIRNLDDIHAAFERAMNRPGDVVRLI